MRIGREAGLRYVYGGNVPGHSSEIDPLPRMWGRGAGADGEQLEERPDRRRMLPGLRLGDRRPDRGGRAMSLVGCFAVPHPPIIIPEVGGSNLAEAEATVRAMIGRAGEGGRSRPGHHRPALAAQPPGPQPDGRLAGRRVQGVAGLLPGAAGAGGRRGGRGAGRDHHAAGRRPRHAGDRDGRPRGDLRPRSRRHGAPGLSDRRAEAAGPAGVARRSRISIWTSMSASAGRSARRSWTRRQRMRLRGQQRPQPPPDPRGAGGLRPAGRRASTGPSPTPSPPATGTAS